MAFKDYQFYREDDSMLITRIPSGIPGMININSEVIRREPGIVVVKDEAELRAAVLNGGYIIIADDIDLDTYLELAIQYTTLKALPGVTLRSTFEDTDSAVLDINHVVFVNANDITLDNLRITSIHGDTFDGFAPITQNGDRTDSTAIITGLSDTSVLQTGLRVSGNGVLGVIVSIDSPTQITISTNATGSLSGPLTFQKNLASHTGIAIAATGIQNLRITNCELFNLYTPIYRAGGFASVVTDNVLIENCDIYNFYSAGILADHQCRKWKILNNRINGRRGAATHAVAHNCIYMQNTQSGHIIAHNECSDTDRMGIETAFTTEAVNIYDNWVHDCGSMGISLGYSRNSNVVLNVVEDVCDIGIELAGSYAGAPERIYCKVLQNTIRRVTPTVAGAYGITVNAVGCCTVALNHIEEVLTAISGSPFGIETINGAFENTIVNNILYRCGEAFIRLNSTNLDYVAGNKLIYENGDAVANPIYASGGTGTIINNSAYAPLGDSFSFAFVDGPYTIGDNQIVYQAEGAGAYTFEGSNKLYEETGEYRMPDIRILVPTSHPTGAANPKLVTATEHHVKIDATTDNVIIQLPKAAYARGHSILFERIDGSGNTVTLDGDGTEEIDGTTTVTIAASTKLRITSFGEGWESI